MVYKQITFFLISLFFYVITSKKFIILTFNQFLLLILLKNIGYDEQGQRNVIVYGNKTKTVYKYNKKRGWLSNIETVNFETGNQYQNIFYTFDAVGNVLSYTNDCLKTGNYSTGQNYDYDALYQLIYVEGTTKYYTTAGLNVPSMEDNYNQTFEFDNIGNMMSKVSKETSRGSHKTNEALNYNLDYTYAQNYAHRVERAGDMNFVYDESGNLILEYEGQPLENPDEDNVVIVVEKDVYATEGAWGYGSNGNGGSQEVPKGHKRYYEWDDRNQLTRTLDSTYDTSYVYNNDGQRVAKYTSSLTATSETLYFNNFWTWHTDTANQFDVGQYSKNIYLGEIRIVTKLVSGKNNYMEVEGKNIYYYHTDHLGSASLVTNYEGKEYERMEYTPYGEVWVDIKQNTGTIYLPYKFSAKEMDSETGLYYYGARYLDPKYSMWKSTDPALAEYIPIASTNDEWSKKNSNLPGMGGIFNHTNFHLYHYAGNNPINYIDPDGRTDVYFIYLYDEGEETYQNQEITSLTEELEFLNANNITYEIIKYTGIKQSDASDETNALNMINLINEAFSDSETKLILFSGHGMVTDSALALGDTGYGFFANNVTSDVSSSLSFVILQACYQGDYLENWKNNIGNDINIIAWNGPTTVRETIDFNNEGLNSRQENNLQFYLSKVKKF